MPMTQCQYDAFVSICFNIGESGFATSTYVQRINAGAPESEVAEAISWWDTPASIIPRRNGEIVQFLGGYIPRIATL
jgi:GH24 family phage-related lysozyme (muramidase)